MPEVGDAQGQGRVRDHVLANEDDTKERAIRGRDGVRLAMVVSLGTKS